MFETYLKTLSAKDHDAQPAPRRALTMRSAPSKNQAGTRAGQQALRAAQVQRAAVGQLVVDLQDVVDQRAVEELGDLELAEVAQARHVVPLARLDGDDLDRRGFSL